jgi:hypothetical protein
VLKVVGENNAIARIGAVGGFMGHVLLVVSAPQIILKKSAVGRAFQQHSRDSCTLVSVRVVECSRGIEGLSEVATVLSIDETGRVLLRGETHGDTLSVNEDPEEVHIWHSPPQFRKSNFCLDVMVEVLEDMRSIPQNWSWSTAVRAFFLSGDISGRIDSRVTMKEILDSWEAQPICTSIVVVFWQRYLHKLASRQRTDPLHLILQVMPLRADRVLPGHLVAAMVAHGWSLWSGPQSFREARGNRERWLVNI